MSIMSSPSPSSSLAFSSVLDAASRVLNQSSGNGNDYDTESFPSSSSPPPIPPLLPSMNPVVPPKVPPFPSPTLTSTASPPSPPPPIPLISSSSSSSISSSSSPPSLPPFQSSDPSPSPSPSSSTSSSSSSPPPSITAPPVRKPSFYVAQSITPDEAIKIQHQFRINYGNGNMGNGNQQGNSSNNPHNTPMNASMFTPTSSTVNTPSTSTSGISFSSLSHASTPTPTSSISISSSSRSPPSSFPSPAPQTSNSFSSPAPMMRNGNNSTGNHQHTLSNSVPSPSSPLSISNTLSSASSSFTIPTVSTSLSSPASSNHNMSSFSSSQDSILSALNPSNGSFCLPSPRGKKEKIKDPPLPLLNNISPFSPHHSIITNANHPPSISSTVLSPSITTLCHLANIPLPPISPTSPSPSEYINQQVMQMNDQISSSNRILSSHNDPELVLGMSLFVRGSTVPTGEKRLSLAEISRASAQASKRNSVTKVSSADLSPPFHRISVNLNGSDHISPSLANHHKVERFVRPPSSPLLPNPSNVESGQHHSNSVVTILSNENPNSLSISSPRSEITSNGSLSSPSSPRSPTTPSSSMSSPSPTSNSVSPSPSTGSFSSSYQVRNSSVALSDTETPQQRLKRFEMRKMRVNEILSSEKRYLKDLESLLTNWFTPLKAQSEIIGGEANWVTMFSNIELIYQFNKRFCNELEERITGWSDKSCVGDLFIQFGPYFRMYAQYAANHEVAVKLMEKLEKSDKWQKFIVKLQSNGIEPLSFLLITPIQRIPRYLLLLRDLIAMTEKSHPDYSSISKSLQLVDESVQHVNEAVRKRENNETIIKIQEKFSGNVELVAPGRVFILSNSLTRRSKKGPKKYEFFLFSNLLSYATVLFTGKYSLVQSILIDEHFNVMDLTDGFTEMEKNCFQITFETSSSPSSSSSTSTSASSSASSLPSSSSIGLGSSLLGSNDDDEEDENRLVLHAKDEPTKKKWMESLKSTIEKMKTSTLSFEQTKGKSKVGGVASPSHSHSSSQYYQPSSPTPSHGVMNNHTHSKHGSMMNLNRDPGFTLELTNHKTPSSPPRANSSSVLLSSTSPITPSSSSNQSNGIGLGLGMLNRPSIVPNTSGSTSPPHRRSSSVDRSTEYEGGPHSPYPASSPNTSVLVGGGAGGGGTAGGGANGTLKNQGTHSYTISESHSTRNIPTDLFTTPSSPQSPPMGTSPSSSSSSAHSRSMSAHPQRSPTRAGHPSPNLSNGNFSLNSNAPNNNNGNGNGNVNGNANGGNATNNGANINGSNGPSSPSHSNVNPMLRVNIHAEESSFPEASATQTQTSSSYNANANANVTSIPSPSSSSNTSNIPSKTVVSSGASNGNGSMSLPLSSSSSSTSSSILSSPSSSSAISSPFPSSSSGTNSGPSSPLQLSPTSASSSKFMSAFGGLFKGRTTK